MSQCPLCKRAATVENGRCGQCRGDISVLQALRDLPAHLYNTGLEAARNGQALDAILKVAAASQLAGLVKLSERSEPWLVLGKLFANEGVDGHAQACFTKAQGLGAAVPEDWMVARRTLVPAAEITASPIAEEHDVDNSLATKKPGMTVEAAPIISRDANRPASAWWAFAMLLLGVGVGLGWELRGYRVDTSVIPAAVGVAGRGNTTGTANLIADATIHAPLPSAPNELTHDVSASPKLPTDPVPPRDLPAAGQRHIVRAGESLWRIARDRLGSGTQWRSLYEANRPAITDPNSLAIGQTLIIYRELE